MIVSSGSTVSIAANPFSRRAVVAILLIGCGLFLALLWMIGTGAGMGTVNDGGAHAGSKGITGYAAMADYLDRRGYLVSNVRSKQALARPGLLVLTPPANADGKSIDKIVAARRYIGPTLVVTPKWTEIPTGKREEGAKPGWVHLGGIQATEWRHFLDELSLRDVEASGRMQWRAGGLTGSLPDVKIVQAGGGTGLVRLVSSADGADTLAGFMDDGGRYPGLETMTGDRVLNAGKDNDLFPLVIVFEPDLLDNFGMADFANARLAEALVHAMGVRRGDRVAFDLTFNGLGRSDNLLTLAFTPPFLAATLCLLMAAVIAGWRAFLRFGPPLATDRAIAFGKQALVSNAAGLVRRSGRLHLLSTPYADRVRENLVRGLGLPRTLDADQASAAIDHALASRHPDAEPFTHVAARLNAARQPQDLLQAARDLYALERMLIR